MAKKDAPLAGVTLEAFLSTCGVDTAALDAAVNAAVAAAPEGGGEFKGKPAIALAALQKAVTPALQVAGLAAAAPTVAGIYAASLGDKATVH